jgi:hypothetical protein
MEVIMISFKHFLITGLLLTGFSLNINAMDVKHNMPMIEQVQNEQANFYFESIKKIMNQTIMDQTNDIEKAQMVTNTLKMAKSFLEPYAFKQLRTQISDKFGFTKLTWAIIDGNVDDITQASSEIKKTSDLDLLFASVSGNHEIATRICTNNYTQLTPKIRSKNKIYCILAGVLVAFVIFWLSSKYHDWVRPVVVAPVVPTPTKRFSWLKGIIKGATKHKFIAPVVPVVKPVRASVVPKVVAPVIPTPAKRFSWLKGIIKSATKHKFIAPIVPANQANTPNKWSGKTKTLIGSAIAATAMGAIWVVALLELESNLK